MFRLSSYKRQPYKLYKALYSVYLRASILKTLDSFENCQSDTEYIAYYNSILLNNSFVIYALPCMLPIQMLPRSFNESTHCLLSLFGFAERRSVSFSKLFLKSISKPKQTNQMLSAKGTSHILYILFFSHNSVCTHHVTFFVQCSC